MALAPSLPGRCLALAVLGLVACGPPSDPPAEAPLAAATVATTFDHARQLERDGRFREAAAEYERLAAGFAAEGDGGNLFYARFRGTRALFDASDFDAVRKAIPDLEELAGSDLGQQAWVAYLKGMLERDTGTMQRALPQAEEALRLARQSTDREAEAAALGLLQSVQVGAGRYSRALVSAQERLRLEQLLDPGAANEATAWNQLANVLKALGRYSEAVDAYEKALAINENLGEKLGIAINQLNLANAHYATGQFPEAFRLTFAALESSKSIDDTYGIVLAHSNFGNMFRQVGNNAAARKHIAEAFAILEGFDAPALHAPTWEFLGRVEHDDRNYAAADEAYRTALRFAEARGDSARAAYQQAWLARNAAASGEFGEARDWAAAAVEASDRLGAPDLVVSSLCSQAFAYEQAGDLDTALASYHRAIAYIESWRGQIGFGDQKMSLAACHLEVYEGAIRVLVALGRAGEAFDVSERVRARRLLDLMMQTPAKAADARTAAQGEPIVHTVAADIAELEADMRSLFPELQAGDAERTGLLTEALEGRARELEKLKSALRQAEPVAGAARYPVPASYVDLQQALLTPERALLAFFWGERDVYGWWIESGRVSAKRLGAVDDVEQRVAFLRAAMQAPAGLIDWRPPAAALFRVLVAPLAPGAQPELFLLPDGPLGYLPFAGLLREPAASPWGATHRLTQGPSAAILLALARAPARGDFERELLAVGGRTAAATATAALRDAGNEALPLPFAAEEVADIAKLFPPQMLNVLTGREATLERWKDLRPGRYRYLHFATHAHVSDREPLETYLVLPQADRLGLAAIREERLNAELVTLSGCETALGRHITGEGILGLPHAFLAAGAQGVLVTLWRVEDRATADFVTRFYTRLREGAPPAEALRLTRRQWLASRGDADPSAWAPFVLVGGAGTAASD